MKNKISRNALCPCGSGDKYKKCCLRQRKNYEAIQLHVAHAASAAAKYPPGKYEVEPVEAARASG